VLSESQDIGDLMRSPETDHHPTAPQRQLVPSIVPAQPQVDAVPELERLVLPQVRRRGADHPSQRATISATKISIVIGRQLLRSHLPQDDHRDRVTIRQATLIRYTPEATARPSSSRVSHTTNSCAFTTW
jgi:hypothetical protein